MNGKLSSDTANTHPRSQLNALEQRRLTEANEFCSTAFTAKTEGHWRVLVNSSEF